MFSNAITAAAVALPLLASAFPQASSTAPAPAPPAPVPTPKTFRIKTELISPADMTALDKNYVSTYHTGAGMNAAVLTPNATLAAPAYLNGTELDFLYDTAMGNTTYSMELPQGDTYQGWIAAEINTAVTSPAPTAYSGVFYINQTNNALWFNTAGTMQQPTANISSNMFAGWQVCYWSLNGEPQLFWRETFANGTLPGSCALVNLVQEFTS